MGRAMCLGSATLLRRRRRIEMAESSPRGAAQVGSGTSRMVGFGRGWRWAVSFALAGFVPLSTAQANPALVVDVDTGTVLYESQATVPWFPASLTKLMTTYVALSAVRE